MECSGARSLYWRSPSVGAAAGSVPYCQYKEVCSPTRPNAKQANELSTTTDPRSCARVVYIAGDTLHHQPMGAGHMTVLQLCEPMAFHVLQWCHPMLASTTRTSCCTWMITLYGARKWIQARAIFDIALIFCTVFNAFNAMYLNTSNIKQCALTHIDMCPLMYTQQIR